MRFLSAVAAALLAAAAAVWLAPYQADVAWRRARLWAAGARRVELSGGLLAYERDGCRAGEPCRCVAFVHGLGDSALTWDKLLLDSRASRPGLRLLAVDMPGTDGSSPPVSASGFGIRAQSRALRAALEPVCPSWAVVANSLGGWTSLWLALDWPQGVRRLVLLDSAGITDPSGRAEESARALVDPTPRSLLKFSRRASFRQRRLPRRALAAAAAAIRARHSAEVVAALRRGELLDHRLARLHIPVAIVWGGADGIIPLEVGRRLRRLIRGSSLEVVARCGHLPQRECPQAVAPLVFTPGGHFQ